MMRTRLTYVPLEVADQFEDFIIKRDVQILDAVKAKTRDYSTLSLLKLLYQLKGNSMTFSELYSKSKIRMKKSFLNYLHLCVDYRFIEKEAVGPNMIYSITDKGRTMLNLFIQKNNWVNNMGNISPDTSQKEIQVSN
jgi:DNA-binding HxlR family transcriptional regulator